MATLYLDAGLGNDTTGNGSSALPWKTIAKANTSATSGDTIICKSSTTAYAFIDQSFTKNLNIEGEVMPTYDPATATWTGAIFSNGGSATQIGWLFASFTVTLSKLILTGASGKGYPGMFGSNVSQTWNNCVLYDLDLTVPSAYGALFLFMTTDGSTLTMNGCLIYDITGLSATKALIIANTYSNYVFNNCTFFYATQIFWNSPNFYVGITSTNSIYYAEANPTVFANQTTNHTYAFNNNSTYNYSAVPAGNNNILVDPLFVDITNRDFRLQSTSPCIETGTIL